MVYRKTRAKVHRGIRKTNTFAKNNLSKSAQKEITGRANSIANKYLPTAVRAVAKKEIQNALKTQRKKPVVGGKTKTKKRRNTMTTMPVVV